MKTNILKQKKIYLILAVIMAVLFAMPQLAEPVHAATAAAGSQTNPAKYNIANNSYEISSSGWYEFSGETSSNNGTTKYPLATTFLQLSESFGKTESGSRASV